MVLREIETQLSSCRRAVSKHARAILGVSPRASHHPGTVCRNPGIVGMLSELSDKFSGMSAFRLSTISSATARFSSDAGASLGLANVSSLGKGCLMQKINR
jgi:hypothetical protein